METLIREYTQRKVKDFVDFSRVRCYSECNYDVDNKSSSGVGKSKYFRGSGVSPLEFQKIFSYHHEDLKPIEKRFSVTERKVLLNTVEDQQKVVSSSSSITTEQQHDLTHHRNINWTDVCKLLPNKTEIDCLMKYRNECDSSINHSKWSSFEEENLLRAIDYFGERDWCRIADWVTSSSSSSAAISSSLPTSSAISSSSSSSPDSEAKMRTPMQCLQHYQLNLNKTLTRPAEWSDEEEKALLEAVALYGTDRTWQHISNSVEGRASSQCFDRWKQINARSKNSGLWKDWEERRLVFAVVAYEKKASGGRTRTSASADQDKLWEKISDCVQCRDEVSCREKWTNVLDPVAIDTSPFTEEEDEIILKESSKLLSADGSAVGWSKIASLLKGRTDSQILRRWKELSDPKICKLYLENSKKRRAVAVPRHHRSKASKVSLDSSGYIPVLSSSI